MLKEGAVVFQVPKFTYVFSICIFVNVIKRYMYVFPFFFINILFFVKFVTVLFFN